MQFMLDLAADFGLQNNLEFSCDPDPVKTKSKAIYMVGKKTTLVKPVNLQLYGKSLPWVTHVLLPRGSRTSGRTSSRPPRH